MFPRLSDILNYIFGTRLDIPVQTYGFMIVIAFAAGALVLSGELKRKEREGQLTSRSKKVLKGGPPSLQDLFYSAVFGFILGWKGIGLIVSYQTFRLNPQDMILSWQGNIPAGLILALVFAGYLYIKKRKERLNPPEWEDVEVHPYQMTANIVLIAAISGIIGAKVLDSLEHLDELMKDPAGTLFSFEGLSFYGGLIVAAVIVAVYAGMKGIRTPLLADAIAPALILAYAVGRIGCQLSGDGCWGIINPDPLPGWLSFLPEWTWRFSYPHNIIDQGILIPGCTGDHCYRLAHAVYPTPFYETLAGFSIFGILMGFRKIMKIPGYLFSVYLILNGTERFLIEEIRINAHYKALGLDLTQAQFIAILMIILGLGGFWYFKNLYVKHRTNTMEK